MLCGAAFGTAAQTVSMAQISTHLTVPIQTITATPTNGPTTITVHARTTDGKLPVGLSDIIVQRGPPPQTLTFVGKNGDWMAISVPPGDYEVVFRNTNYVEAGVVFQRLSVGAGTNYSIDFVLSNGATFKGRVLDDATGKPVANEHFYGYTSHFTHHVHTDAEGRYEVNHVAGALKINVETSNYWDQIVKLDAADEGSTVTVPDIRLQFAAWTRLRVERAAEVNSKFTPIITTAPTNGATTITVHARTTDGKPTVGMDCKPSWYSFSSSTMTNTLPSFVGTNGDWTATNIPPERYLVALQFTNYAADSDKSVSLQVFAGTNYTVDFVLSRGATFEGRVLDDATGEPIPNANVSANSRWENRLHIDSEGRYEVPHVAGSLEIHAIPTNYVEQDVKLGAAAEDSTVTVPDIRLKHGGWISGRIERPAGVESNLFLALTMIQLEFQGALPTNSAIQYVLVHEGGTFHTDELPPGAYTLHTFYADQRWHG